MRDAFLSKIETKIDDIRKLSPENLISQQINSNDYYVKLQIVTIALFALKVVGSFSGQGFRGTNGNRKLAVFHFNSVFILPHSYC